MLLSLCTGNKAINSPLTPGVNSDSPRTERLVWTHKSKARPLKHVTVQWWPRSTQRSTLRGTIKWVPAKGGDALRLGSKGRYGLFAGNTVCCHTWALWKMPQYLKASMFTLFTYYTVLDVTDVRAWRRVETHAGRAVWQVDLQTSWLFEVWLQTLSQWQCRTSRGSHQCYMSSWWPTLT